MRVAALFVVMGIGLLGCKRRIEPAQPSSPTHLRRAEASALLPDVRTPEELAARLARAGINVSMRNRPLLNRPGRTVMALSDDVPDQPATVFVYNCLDDADARDQAASMSTGAFTSGRFAIGTRDDAAARDRDLLAKIEAALSAPIGSRAITVAE